MIKVQNIQSGEIVNVLNVVVEAGRIISEARRPHKGERFYNSYPMMQAAGESEDGRDLHTLAEGWSLATKGERKERKPRTKKAEPVITETTDEPTVEAVVVEPVAETVATESEDDMNEQALIAAIKNLRGGAVDMAKVREIVREEFALLAAEEPKKAAKVRAKIIKKDTKEVHCAKYDRILAKMSRGRRVYLHGPAGSGKSHTAEQIAADLGLTFYGQTTIQFAHDVRGYGDAGGNFQDTPFFKAFSEGGLYFQDEYDRSNAEAAIVLNSALANGWYDFPIVGRVEAHPDFRFMAAGNTLMKGADDGYITGQEIDPSSRDRFDFYFEVGYIREVELHIAHGNEEIVDFVEDVRRAIKSCGIEHVVSYRATAAMTDEIENENDLISCCEEGVFKGLDVDARREIYQALENKDSRWAKALKKTL